MQLELFDIRSEDTAPAGRTGRTGLNTGHRRAGENDDGTRGSGDDFLSSLRMVSKADPDEKGAGAADAKAPAREAEPSPGNPTPLGELFNTVMRAWPEGKRPNGGDQVQDIAGSGAGRVLPEGDADARNDGRLQFFNSAPGAAEKAAFTAALIRQLGKPQTGRMTVAGPGHDIQDGAAPDNADRPRNGRGISLLGLAAERTSRAASARTGDPSGPEALEPVDGARGIRRRILSGLKSEPLKNQGTAASKTGGAAVVSETIEKSGIGRAMKFIRADTAGNRLAGEGEAAGTDAYEEVPAGKSGNGRTSALNGNPAHGRAGSAAVSADFQALEDVNRQELKIKTDRAALARSRTAGSGAVSDQVTADRPEAGVTRDNEPAVRFAPAFAGGGRPTQAKRAADGHRQARLTPADSREGEGRLQTVADNVEKSPAADAKKGLRQSEARAVDGERFGGESNSAPGAGEQKGGETIRLEAAEAKVKAVENGAPAPRSQPTAPVTASPVPEKTMPDRVDQARVMEQISARVRLLPKKGGNEMRIHLKPEALGQVQLKILAQDQNITVKMVAETGAAKEIIENNIGQLRADLNAQGLNVEKLAVDVFTSNDAGDRDTAGQRGSFTRNGGGSANQQGAREDEAADATRPMQAAEAETDGGTLVGVFA
jgi:hypothetical protein